ncbi:MAG: PHP domain-containing protein [Anaerolineaceae bacterium]
MGLADLNVHSIHSYDGTVTIPAILKHVANNIKLNVIALTDHDQTCGVEEAVQLAPAYGIEVIPGCEVSTAEGHLLTLFVDRSVQSGLSYLNTTLRTGEIGGLCIAPHPTAPFFSSVSFLTIQRVLQNPDAAWILVSIEAYNGGLVLTHRNAYITAIWQSFDMAQVGNSDAHVLRTIGQGATCFKGKTAADLKQALIKRETQIQQEHSMNGFEVLWTYLFQHLLLKIGWARWNAGPKAPVIYRWVGQISRYEQTAQIS